MVRFAQVVMSMVVVLGALVAFAGPAGAAPTDPVARLVAAGVPVDVAIQAASARPAAAGQVVPITRSGNPGAGIDAVIDHQRTTITVIQRWLQYEPSQLTAAWVNLANGRAGRSGLNLALPGYIPGSPRTPYYRTIDRAAVLPTGRGPVVIVVYGRFPAPTGLFAITPSGFGILTPRVLLLQV